MYLDGLKYKILNFDRHLSANYFLRLFLHNLGVLNLNMSVNILSLVSFTFIKAKQQMAAKTTSVSYFCYILLHDFWFLHDLELIHLCIMLFDQNDLCLTFKFKIVTANTHTTAVFYACKL